MVLLERAKERSKIGQLNSFWFKFVSSLYIPGIGLLCKVKIFVAFFTFSQIPKPILLTPFSKLNFISFLLMVFILSLRTSIMWLTFFQSDRF